MEAFQQLQELASQKKGGNHKELKHRMELTKRRRHQWIREQCPMMFDVIEKIPCLSTNKWVCNVLCNLTGNCMYYCFVYVVTSRVQICSST